MPNLEDSRKRKALQALKAASLSQDKVPSYVGGAPFAR